MKLQRYLTETEDFNKVKREAFELMAPFIKKNCKQFLKNGGHVYRGTRFLSGRNSVVEYGRYSLYEVTPRLNRKPRDTPKNIHDALDKEFQKKFGWKARSEGVFTNTNLDSAEYYGNSYLFFPFDGFKYVWNGADDSYETISNNLKKIGLVGFQVFRATDEQAEKVARIIMRKYTDKRLSDAFIGNTSYEIVFKCKKYYLLSARLEDELDKI